MNLKYEIRVEYSIYQMGFTGYLLRSIPDGKQILTSAGYTDYKPGNAYEHSFSLSEEAAQQLMDDLWRGGIRPTEGRGSAGSLAATERHLKDMQTITFNQLGISNET